MIKSWNIWDFPDNFYILLKKDAHNKFFNEMFKEYGGKRPYAKLLGIYQKDLKSYWRRYFKKNGKYMCNIFLYGYLSGLVIQINSKNWLKKE